MARPALWVPNDPVDLVRVEEGVEVVGNPRFAADWSSEVRGAYLPALLWQLLDRTPPGRPVRGVRDDNRTAILPERRVTVDEHEYFLAVKGCGAEYDAYEPVRLDAHRLRALCHDPALAARLDGVDGGPAAFIVGERWWGYAPYGGQAGDSALLALLASLRADRNQIAGFYLCPLVAAVRLPDRIARAASEFYWYRRYDGAYWQEVRLMPSNVRLFFHSPVTLGVDSGRVFSLFGLTSFDACERFLERLARSTLAAITLYARSLRRDAATGRYVGLDYDEVYLDKDAVIAPDGTLHFADLEGVEEFFSGGPEAVRERVEMQFYRNLYEATYALEAMALETWRAFGLGSSGRDRRRWVLDVLERALHADPYARVERTASGSRVEIRPAVDPDRLALSLEWASEEGE